MRLRNWPVIYSKFFFLTYNTSASLSLLTQSHSFSVSHTNARARAHTRLQSNPPVYVLAEVVGQKCVRFYRWNRNKFCFVFLLNLFTHSFMMRMRTFVSLVLISILDTSLSFFYMHLIFVVLFRQFLFEFFSSSSSSLCFFFFYETFSKTIKVGDIIYTKFIQDTIPKATVTNDASK